MKAYYNNYLEKSPQAAIFRARTDNAVITAYYSGKVLFQGENIDAEISKWKSEYATPEHTRTSQNNKSNTGSFIPPTSVLTGNQIVSNESRTGDYFWHITTAEVYVTH